MTRDCQEINIKETLYCQVIYLHQKMKLTNSEGFE